MSWSRKATSPKYPYTDDGKMAGGKNDIPLPDPLIWMSYVGARTEKINLATGILIMPQRNPVVAAKQIATMDFMTGGRVLLGIGVGWMEEEFAAIKAPFEARGRATDEYVGVMRELWSSDMPTYDGEFFSFKGAHMQPKPVNGSVRSLSVGIRKLRRGGLVGSVTVSFRHAVCQPTCSTWQSARRKSMAVIRMRSSSRSACRSGSKTCRCW